MTKSFLICENLNNEEDTAVLSIRPWHLYRMIIIMERMAFVSPETCEGVVEPTDCWAGRESQQPTANFVAAKDFNNFRYIVLPLIAITCLSAVEWPELFSTRCHLMIVV